MEVHQPSAVRRIGERLLSNDYSIVLDARKELDDVLASCATTNVVVVGGGVQDDTAGALEALFTEIRSAVAPPPIELQTLLCERLAHMLRGVTSSTSSLPLLVTSAALFDSVLSFLCASLDADTTALGVAAASALVAAIVMVNNTTSSAPGSIAASQLKSMLSVHLPRTTNLLRLFDVGMESTAVGPGGRSSRAAIDDLCAVLRTIPCHAVAEHNNNGNAAEGVVPNVLDGFVLDELIGDAILAGDVLLVMNALYAGGCILRSPSCSTPNGRRIMALVGLALGAAEEEAQDGLESMDASMAPMMRPFAMRAVTILCDGSSAGAAIVSSRSRWVERLLACALMSGEDEDAPAAWDALAAICTTSAGILSLKAQEAEVRGGGFNLLRGDDVADQCTSTIANNNLSPPAAAFVFNDDLILPVVERIVARGRTDLRVALLHFIACAARGGAYQEAAMMIDERRRQRGGTAHQEEDSACTTLVVSLVVSRDVFRSVWKLRNTADDSVRLALWQCVNALLVSTSGSTTGSASAVLLRGVVVPSCAAHVASSEPEASADVRVEMLRAAQQCLREPSVSLFHERLAAVVKGGVWPNRFSAVTDAEMA